ncbi:MAG: PAS domain S-box protein [Bacteroidales bacterium]|nr:PAS domain S-box protein [Bacteroidales bacterium]
MATFNILIVEDELISSKLLQNYLIGMGHNVVGVVPSGEEAIAYVIENNPDLILMDIELSGKLNGIETVEIIRQTKEIPTLFLTGQTDRALLERAKAVEPIGYLLKPVQAIQLEIIIEMTQKKILVDQELENYQKYLERLVVDRTKGLLEEVEKHKKSLKKIEENEIKLSAITSSANDAIIMFNEYGQINFWNLEATRVFGYKDEEIINHNIRVLFSSDSLNDEYKQSIELIQDVIENKHLSKNVELSATHMDGRSLPIEMSMATVEISGGLNIVCIVRDITERKKYLEEIERFKLIADIANYGLAITDLDGRIIYLNKYFAKIHGYETEEILGENFDLLSAENSPYDFSRMAELTLKQDGFESEEIWHVKKDQQLLPLFLNTTLIKDKKNNPTFFAFSGIDITQNKEYEKNILKSKSIAEDSDRMKSAFLSTISHELRTPLNAIIGFSELIKIGGLDTEDINDFNEEILGSGLHLLSIVEDILDVSLLEKHDLKIERTEFSLNVFLKHMYDKFKDSKRYENKAIELLMKVDVKSGDPSVDQINTDIKKLEHIFTKLLDNAYKFSDEGKIEFGYNRRNYKYEFYVKDQGVGIEKEKLKLIFDNFEQATNDENLVHNGLGLGLSIVRHLLDVMGGEIRVESEVGKGSTFYFTIEN